MIQIELHTTKMNRNELKSLIEDTLKKLPEDSVVKIRISGNIDENSAAVVTAKSLRSLAPQTMNINAILVDHKGYSWREGKTRAH